jgi:hypothetical protein
MAEDLIGIGTISPVSFQEFLVNVRHLTLLSQLRSIDSLLCTGELGTLLRRDVERLRTTLCDAVAAAECPDAMDLELSDKDKMALLREFILSYGLLLREWPAIYGCAQTLGMQSSGPCAYL